MQDNTNRCLDGTSVSELLHRAAARIDAHLDQRLANVGLTSRQYLLLKCVEANNGINQMGLTELSGIDRSTMTDMVGRLVTRGLLSRERKASDARAYAVSITDTGRQRLAVAGPIVIELDSSVINRLEPHLRDQFMQTLTAIGDRREP